MTTTTIQLVDSIAALDRDKQVLDQTTINEIKKQRDLYKTALDTFAEGLKQLQAKKASLQERLVVKIDALSPLKESVNQDVLSSRHNPLDSETKELAAHLLASDLTEIQALSKFEVQDHKIQELTQETIEKCSRQRDLYRDALYRLNSEVEKTQQDISSLEAQLAEQALHASIFKIAREPALSSSNADLAKDVSKVTISRITSKDRDAVLHNLILLLYLEKKKTIDLDALSDKDPALLQAAKEAFDIIEQDILENRRSGPHDHQEVVRTLLSSKERNVNHKAMVQSGSKKNFDTLEQETNSVIGKAKEIFAQFYSKRERQLRERKFHKEGEAQYADFPFNTVAFLAGQLCLLQKILEGCKEKLGSTHKKTQEVEKELKNIQSVQASFFELLKKCRLPKPKY
ncbi:MAG: hypothetical protein JSS10_04940 [Verrucomicrobia bacterium]|nr:hypothetical protein [Verrucomicrobiota bacterium]